MNRLTARVHRLPIVGLIGILVVSLGCQRAHSDPIAPSDKDKLIQMAVANWIPQFHLSKRPLDDQISERGLGLFLKSLDPRKLYFYQSDIDSFQKYAHQLDDMAQRGDLSAAYEIFTVFLRRVDERSAIVQQLLAQEHDFTVDEEIVVKRDDLSYPKTEAEALDRWRKRIKLDLLAEKAERLAARKMAAAKGEAYHEDESAVTKIERRYRSIQKRWHQTNSDDLLEMFLSALLSAYDPHTSYMSPSTHRNFKIRMGLNLQGIGAVLQSEDGYTIVKSIVAGGAADKQGDLKPEDKITAVGQGDGSPMVDVVDMKLDEVVDMIRGTPGTVVRLRIERRGAPPRVIEITRAKIELTDSEAQSEVFEVGQKPDGSPLKIGVIDLPSFYSDMDAARRGESNYKSTTRDLRRILSQFKEKGVDGVVLDLRMNGGGSLQEAIEVTGLFIEQGPVVQVKGSQGYVDVYRDRQTDIAWDGPLVVVVSKFSASASEIFAGAIQDYHRGIVVGDKATHGKGTVQSLTSLGEELFRGTSFPPELGAVKVTMQQFYRPSGDSTQKRGVLSDIELPSLTTHYDVGESDLDHPVEFDKVDPARFDRFPFVNASILEQVRSASERRRAKCEDFASLLHDIDLYLQQKEKRTVTLHAERFLKEREELYADQKEMETFEQFNDKSKSNIRRDFYMDEVLNIMADYVRVLKDGGYSYTPSQRNAGVLNLLFGGSK